MYHNYPTVLSFYSHEGKKAFRPVWILAVVEPHTTVVSEDLRAGIPQRIFYRRLDLCLDGTEFAVSDPGDEAVVPSEKPVLEDLEADFAPVRAVVELPIQKSLGERLKYRHVEAVRAGDSFPAEMFQP